MLLSRRFLLYCTCSLSVYFCHAQTLIPYLGDDGKIGFADTLGQLVIPNIYNKAKSDIFHSESAAVFMENEKNETILLLRNGLTFPYNSSIKSDYVYDYGYPEGTHKEVWKHVIALKNGTDLTYINLNNGTQVKGVYDSPNSMKAWFPLDMHKVSKGFDGVFLTARFGILKVQVAKGQYNFYDRDLKPIFKESFSEGTVVNPSFFVVVNEKQKCAIADRSGKLLTKFGWDMIFPTEKEDVFIVNPPVDLGRADQAVSTKVGLIDKTGKNQLDRTYLNIQSENEDYLIVQSSEGYSIIDYNGKNLIEPTSRNILHITKGLFYTSVYKSATLFDVEKSGMPKDTFTEIVAYPGKQYGEYFIKFEKDGVVGMMDENLKVLHQGKYKSISPWNIGDQTYFLCREENEKQSIVNLKGENPLKRSFTKINNSNGFIILQDGDLAGIANEEGIYILPMEFEETYISFSGTGHTLYGKKNHLYQAFSESGARLSMEDCIHPMEKRKNFYMQPTVNGKPQPITFYDGQHVVAPLEWGRRFPMEVMKSPIGPLVFKEEPSAYVLYNTKLQPLQPAGTVIPRKEGSPKLFEKTGMMAVYVYNENARLIPPPKEVPSTSSPQPRSEIKVVKDLEMDQAVPEFHDTEGSYIKACGVMDAKGEWVIQAKENAKFVPVSWNVVLEYLQEGPRSDTERPHTLHIVHQAQQTSIPIVGIDDVNGAKDWENARCYQHSPSNSKNGGMQTRSSWITREGKLLAPFQFMDGPTHLKNYNLATLWQNDARVKCIIDKEAKILVMLEGVEQVHTYFNNGFAGVKKDGKWGIIDSLGNLVWQPNYGDLKILMPGKYVEVLEGNEYIAYNWEGKEVRRSSSRFDIRFNEKGNSFWNYSLNNIPYCTIFDENQQEITTLKDATYRDMVSVSSMDRYATFSTATYEPFIYDIKHKILFRGNGK